MQSHSPGLQGKPDWIQSTLIHGSPSTLFVSFSFLLFFSPNLEISVRAIHLDPITDCFANVFLPAQTVFRWLHMLVLISYRWGWQCCTSSEWIRVGRGDCWDLLCAQHMSLCCWQYPSLCVLFLPRSKLIKAAHIIPELGALLATKDSYHSHWLINYTEANVHALKLLEALSWTTALPSSLFGQSCTICPSHKPSLLQLGLHL